MRSYSTPAKSVSFADISPRSGRSTSEVFRLKIPAKLEKQRIYSVALRRISCSCVGIFISVALEGFSRTVWSINSKPIFSRSNKTSKQCSLICSILSEIYIRQYDRGRFFCFLLNPFHDKANLCSCRNIPTRTKRVYFLSHRS